MTEVTDRMVEAALYAWNDDRGFNCLIKMRAAIEAALREQEQSGPQSGHSRDLPVNPASQDYGHLAGDKPALTEPSKMLPSDTRLWHIIGRHQREAGLDETVPLNRAMYRACMEAMLDVDPVPQQRRPLTDEEIESIWKQKPRWHAPPIGTTDIEFARAVERAHGIGGEK